jgi:nucleoside-diphosphate-sugar epimerase
LGSHLARAALDAGLPTRGVVRTPAKAAWLADQGMALAQADLADPAALVAAFRGCDAVIANAALAAGWTPQAPEAFVQANVEGAANTLRAAAEAGVRRIIYISSVAVYRTRLGAPVGENDPQLDPDRPGWDLNRLTTDPHYSRTKTLAEREVWRLASALDLRLTVLRPGPIYGSRDDKLTARYAGWMKRRVLLAPTLALPHVHAGDVALAALAALKRPVSVGRVYNVTGRPERLLDLYRTWARLAGRGPLLVPVPVPLRVAFDNSRVERELEIRFRSLEDGLREVLAAG